MVMSTACAAVGAAGLGVLAQHDGPEDPTLGDVVLEGHVRVVK